MVKIKIILICALLNTTAIAQSYMLIDWQYGFNAIYDPNVSSILRLGYMTSPQPWSDTRGCHKDTPGDYFMEFCRGRKNIDSTLAESLSSKYAEFFGNLIPKSIFYECKIPLDTVSSAGRQEYFVRYTDGKDVFVVSGWWPKFIKFYKAALGNIKYNKEGFRKQLAEILKDDSMLCKIEYYAYEKGDFYLFRGSLGNRIVNNYNIGALHYEWRNHAPDLGQPPPMFSDWYNIIEITIYLDKEFMP